MSARRPDPSPEDHAARRGEGKREPLRPATRRMVVSDLPAVMEVERLAFQHPWSAELFARELVHEWSVILLAIPEDPPGSKPRGERQPEAVPIYGFVIYWVVHDEVHVLNIATHPDFRSRGIGRTLMAAAIAHARHHEAKLVTLEVRRSNLAALHLYRALGFRAVGVRPNYYPEEGEDALVMNLAL